MSRTITDEKIKLSIIVDGNPAQKELFQLEKSVRDLNSQQKELRKEKQLLEKQGQKDTERYKAVTAAIKENTLSITAAKTKMGELQNQLGLTGLTMGQLQQKSIALKAALRNMVPGSENYKATQAELTKVTARIDELRGKATAAKFSIGSMADAFNRYQGLAISAIAATTGIVLSIQKVIDINGKLSDAQADAMKTTGMNKKEVDELTKSFGMLETRTSRIDLLKIAEQGGRLGIPKDEIQDFVKSMNMAAVALGDSFSGGVDEVAEKLGKIKFLFKETQNMNVEDAYTKIGSAINDLGANGTANEQNIAEFTQRIGSLTDVLKPTVQETLALGTAFEESGIEAETASRAYNIFMKQASTESGKFAQVMRMSKKSVEDLINANPLEFMLKFSEGLKGMNATEVAKTLDFLGINADGANKVIGAMGNNVNRFRELINLSNNSFEQGSSIINEYNVKNENLAATLEKISKKISGFFSSESFINWLSGAVSWFAKFIGATEDADGSVTRWKQNLVLTAKIITIVIASMVSYKAALQLISIYTNGVTQATTLMNIAQKANALTGGLLKTIFLGLQYAYYTLTLQTDKATIAQQRFNLATKANPIGLVIGLIVGLIATYALFNKETSKAIDKQKNLNDVRAAASKSVQEEKSNIENLLKIAKDETQSKSNREAAIKRINSLSPEYLKNITLETINTLEAKKAIDQYLVSLDKKAMKEAYANKRLELAQKVIDTKKDKETNTYGGFFGGKITDFEKIFEAEQRGETSLKVLSYNWNKYKLDSYKKYRQSIIDAKLALKELTQEEAKFLKKNADLYVGGNTSTSDYNVPDGATGDAKKNPNSSKEEILKLQLENERRFADESLRIARQIEDDKIAIMQDGYEKENAIEALRYKREIEDLQRQKVNAIEMAKLDEDIAKAKADKDMTKYNALLEIKKGWQEKNKQLDAQMQELTEGKLAIHQTKLATIQEKGAKTQLQQEKEAYDRAKVERETKFQEQLAALGNNQRAKEKLTREFQKNELDQEEKFLRDLINKLNKITGKGNIGKIDLDLLTPEQVEQFKVEAEKAGLTLQELINKRNQLLYGEAVSNAQALGVAKQSTDILGFSSDNWQVFFDNLAKGKMGIDEMVFAVQALTNAYSMYDQFLTANENAQLKSFQRNAETKKKRLKQQLDAGLINQHQYKKGVEKIDDDLDKKKADVEYKQAKRQKLIAAMNIVNSTAQAIIGIWAQFPKFDFGATAAIMSGVVGALGALQLATVLAQPLPARGAEKGLYPDYVKREQDGKVFRTTGTSSMKTGLYSKPRLLVGEGPGDMPEMVIDKQSYAQMSPYVKSLLIRELRGVRGFENGYYNEKSMRIEVPASSGTSVNSNDALMQLVAQNTMVMAENLAVMKDLRDKGVIGKFYRNDIKSMSELDKGLNDYYELKNNSKL